MYLYYWLRRGGGERGIVASLSKVESLSTKEGGIGEGGIGRGWPLYGLGICMVAGGVSQVLLVLLEIRNVIVLSRS